MYINKVTLTCGKVIERKSKKAYAFAVIYKFKASDENEIVDLCGSGVLAEKRLRALTAGKTFIAVSGAKIVPVSVADLSMQRNLASLTGLR